MLSTVRESARIQSTPEHRENYLTSCENHGGDLAEIARQVRKEFDKQSDCVIVTNNEKSD